MPEHIYDTSFYSSGRCKCAEIRLTEAEIDKLSKYIIPDVLDLKIGYNGIYYMYSDLVRTTEKALYIKEDRFNEIKSEISDNEETYISDINSCIKNIYSCLEIKEIKLEDLEVIDSIYHDD
jgi:hypothetical protein